MKSGKCPKCGSRKIMSHLPVSDHFNYSQKRAATIDVEANPDALLFKGLQSATLEAFVCAGCGFTEQYVQETRDLWEAYQTSRR